MAFYENVFIARQDVSTTQVEALTEQFNTLIEANGGKVTKKEYWGLKSLSFRIKKNRKGHYMLLNIDAPAAAVHELERNMRIHEDVVRYLTVRVEVLEEVASAMMQARSERSDRGDRGDRGGWRRDRDDGPPRRDDAPRVEAPRREEVAEVRGGDA
ncbi:MAG: 30S ribosomal protein S6 [Alphaproteobacteria bacterium]|nr:30S ribosomal protein S6 [Alphaproteobacteria bacterium]